MLHLVGQLLIQISDERNHRHKIGMPVSGRKRVASNFIWKVWHSATILFWNSDAICALRMLKLDDTVDKKLTGMVTAVLPLPTPQTATNIVSTVTTVCPAPLCDDQCWLQHGVLAMLSSSCTAPCKSIPPVAHFVVKQQVVLGHNNTFLYKFLVSADISYQKFWDECKTYPCSYRHWPCLIIISLYYYYYYYYY